MFNASVLKHSPLIASLIFLAAVLLMVIFLIWPAWTGIAQISNQILADRGEADSMQQQDVVVTDFKAKYPGYEDGLKTIDSMGVDPNDPVHFFEFIEAAAAQYGVKADIQLAPQTQDQPTPNIFEILIQQSQFPNVLRFSKALENGPYAVSIQKMDIRNNSVLDEKNKVSVAGVDAIITIATLAK